MRAMIRTAFAVAASLSLIGFRVAKPPQQQTPIDRCTSRCVAGRISAQAASAAPTSLGVELRVSDSDGDEGSFESA
jgi:hypothetical protein